MTTDAARAQIVEAACAMALAAIRCFQTECPIERLKAIAECFREQANLEAVIDRQLLAGIRPIVREEVRAAMDDHEADLAVARVRRSAALEELARLERRPSVNVYPGFGDHGHHLVPLTWASGHGV